MHKCIRTFAGVCLALITSGTLSAKQSQWEQCGTYDGRLQEELFLHNQELKISGGTGQRSAASRAEARSASIDFGDVAVVENTGGIVTPSNSFNLSNRTVTIKPAVGGYSVESSGGSFNAAASAQGTRLLLQDDDSRQMDLPFAFRFFNIVYQQVWVNSNGSVTFGAGDNDFTGTLGHFLAGAPAIAGMLTDLDPSTSGEIRVFSQPGQFVITWDRVRLYSPDGQGTAQTFQIRLLSDNRIEIAYGQSGLPFAVVGFTAGGLQPAEVVGFRNASSSGAVYPTGAAEVFSAGATFDTVSAAQRFYETHEDAYDLLVLYSTDNVSPRAGRVAFTAVVRSEGSGYGVAPMDRGKEFGSDSRLKAVLNMGLLSQYPTDSFQTIPLREPIPDTAVSQLAHQMGHLFLSHVSIFDAAGAEPFPMLGRDFGHWSFNYNSDGSVMEGTRIQDNGEGSNPRFVTTGAVDRYSPLDQYLMGLRNAAEVPPSFVVVNSSMSGLMAPQAGIPFNGDRRDVTVEEIVARYGERRPNASVAQQRFRIGFVLVVPAGGLTGGASTGAISQVDTYRREFANYFASITGNRATLDTALRREVRVSLAPRAGAIVASQQPARIEVATPPDAPVTFNLSPLTGRLSVPATVTLPAGAASVDFVVEGTGLGVEELSITASDGRYEAVAARVEVRTLGELKLEVAAGNHQLAADAAGGALPAPVVFRVVDENGLAFAGVRVVATGGGSVSPAGQDTDVFGNAAFLWTPQPGNSDSLNGVIDSTGITAVATALGRPEAGSQGLLNGASFQPRLAAGGVAVLFGTSLAAGVTAQALSLPFPSDLGGVRVKVNDMPAPLYFVSDGQLNFLIPMGLPAGPANVVVETRLGVSEPYVFFIDDVAPGIFSDAASGLGAILVSGTGQNTLSRPVASGEFLEIYGTGLGAVNPTDPMQQTLATPTVTIAGIPAEVVFSGQTGTPGLYQVNVRVPSGVPAGGQELTMQVNGVDSNPVTVHVQNGN